MKVLIISDTHGHARNLKAVLERVAPVDALIHCGDVEGEEDYIAELAGCPLYVVAGNNDYFSALEREADLNWPARRFFSVTVTTTEFLWEWNGSERRGRAARQIS